MTEISFHFNAPDKYQYGCRVIRKALRGGHQVAVAGDAEDLDRLDAELWTFSPLDFIAHCRADAGADMIALTPVVLGLPSGPESVAKPGQVLLNLGGQVPTGFERYERLIELVTVGPEERQLGRARWKYYSARGYALIQHDLAKPDPSQPNLSGNKE